MCHPIGSSIELVGTEEGGRGRSCEEHEVCGEVSMNDTIVRLRVIQIINGNYYNFITDQL